MQEAIVGRWAQESHLSVRTLGSLHELNHRFLDLAAARNGGWTAPGGAGFSPSLAARLAPLSGAQRQAAAGCPYALFDLRFQDDGHWRSRLEDPRAWHVADEAVIDDKPWTSCGWRCSMPGTWPPVRAWMLNCCWG